MLIAFKDNLTFKDNEVLHMIKIMVNHANIEVNSSGRPSQDLKLNPRVSRYLDHILVVLDLSLHIGLILGEVQREGLTDDAVVFLRVYPHQTVRWEIIIYSYEHR